MKKRMLALLLAAAMVLSLAACSGGGDQTTAAPGTDAATTAAAGNNETSPADSTQGDNSGEAEAAQKYFPVTGDPISMTQGDADGGEVNHTPYAGIAGKDYTDEKVYTLNDYTGGTTNMKWDPVNWETNQDAAILDYLSSGFYAFTLNENRDGDSIICEMAADFPEDVTSQYVGSYGVEEGDTAKAFRIPIRQDLKWEDGTPINADSFIYSYREMLDPIMKNRRADSMYAGSVAVYGAKNYVYQGQNAFTPLGMTVQEFIDGGGDVSTLYVDMTGFWNVTAPDGGQYASVTDEEQVRDAAVEDETADEAFVSGKYLFDTYLAPGCPYEANAAELVGTMEKYEDNYSFDNVGILKTGDYELTFIYTTPIENPDYNVCYNNSTAYLLHPELWESCKSYYDSNNNKVEAGSDAVNQITTNYGTSVETSQSYGPYKLTYFELDKQYTMERNENWYGYVDGNHLGQYQTDIISVQVIPEQATALLAFLNGELDSVSLSSEDMASYGTSDYIRYEPQSYTTKLSINTDSASLASRGVSVLENVNFRHAFSLAIDRNTFAASYTTAGSAGHGLLNYLYLANPVTGSRYRDSEGGMQALVKLYGLTWGEDGDFDTLEEAYEAITGYDMTEAQRLMQLAYDQCVADGSYDGNSKVEITLSVYASDDVYVQMFNYLNEALQNACKGTGFDGKVSMVMKVDQDYYDTIQSGGTDMIFSTWGGAASLPYTLLYECYSDAADGSGNQQEYGFDTKKVNVTIEIDGVSYTSDLQTWARWADGDLTATISSGSNTLAPFASYDTDSRSAAFGQLEYAYLSYYTVIPLYYRNVASLISQKINYGSDTFVTTTTAFGGVRYMTFNYSDDEWKDVVAAGLSY